MALFLIDRGDDLLAVIIANGEFQKTQRLNDVWENADLRIAADGGARQAREHLLLPPHIVIGDMDSLDHETDEWLTASHVERQQFPRAKDTTDLELALDLAQHHGASEIVILGALGHRVDQFLGNVLLLTRDSRITIMSGAAELKVLTALADPVTASIEGEIGETVSLIPLSEQVEGIRTDGLAFPLRSETLSLGSTRGISNEMLAVRARVEFSSGRLLILHQSKSDTDSEGGKD